jgi:hypothetical protein
MSKIAPIGLSLAIALVLAASVVSAGVAAKPAAMSGASVPAAGAGFNALDGRRIGPESAMALSGFAVDPPLGAAGPAGGERDGGYGLGRPELEPDEVDAGGASHAEALPLSQFAGANAKLAVAGVRPGMWDFLTRVRYGGLPEPASWALILIGFGMIGGAVRGFVVANRRLARLQPEDLD